MQLWGACRRNRSDLDEFRLGFCAGMISRTGGRLYLLIRVDKFNLINLFAIVFFLMLAALESTLNRSLCHLVVGREKVIMFRRDSSRITKKPPLRAMNFTYTN